MKRETPEPVPPVVREYFANAGRKGGLRGSRADKSRAGKLGAAALRRKLIEEAKAQEQAQEQPADHNAAL